MRCPLCPDSVADGCTKKKSIHINNSPKCTSGIHTYKLQYKLQAVERRGLSPRPPPAGRRPRDPGAVGFARREGFIARCQCRFAKAHSNGRCISHTYHGKSTWQPSSYSDTVYHSVRTAILPLVGLYAWCAWGSNLALLVAPLTAP